MGGNPTGSGKASAHCRDDDGTWHAGYEDEDPCPLGMNYVLPLVLLTAYCRHVVSFAKHLVFMICDRAVTYGSSCRRRSHMFV
jgi:hypothetical protein